MDAAAHWIRAGLPLRCLKIVMYEGITQDVRRMFEALKAKLMAQNEKLKVRFNNCGLNEKVCFQGLQADKAPPSMLSYCDRV